MRHLLGILLLISPLMLPIVTGQSYTTITTQVSSIQVMTYTAGSSLTTSLLQPQQLIKRAVSINATTGTSMGCETFSLTFNGTQGEYLTGNFTSDIPVGFFVMQDSIYQNWLKSGTCGSFPSAISGQPSNLTSYAFNVALPVSGMSDIILVNYSNLRNADVFLTAYLSSAMITSTERFIATFTSTILGQSEVVQQQASSPVNSLPVFVGIILAAIIAMAFAAITMRRRRGQVKTSQGSSTQTSQGS